jgi:predicted esterase
MPGIRALELATARDTLLYVPPTCRPGIPAALAVTLHGAGGEAQHGLDLLLPETAERGLLLLAPASRRATWDVLTGGYGPDVALLNRALIAVFAHYTIDPERVAITGFSDGASYALSLGLINGGLFRHILAFSPGFALPTRTADAPAIFLSHGREDPVLPIERCGRRIAVRLRSLSYDIDYREFAGGHVVPTDMVEAAFRRFLA